ncbi:uncharacterized protein LOC143255879 isoform X1 [Tachypleus tridentatus]|uniref:uncharacterized protein LOC143255879 isoform X1 n=1 Tax=Tachypleus tridentatus TaxID=6853 RepID=UPI003FD4819F
MAVTQGSADVICYCFVAILPAVVRKYHTPVSAIRCFQCSSDQESDGEDQCGAYEHFDTERNVAVDCLGEEAVTPGTFCYKSIQQSPRGFIWDGRWRTVIRRCAQVSERGNNWGCDWGYKENGVYWEKCYCAEDECNGARNSRISMNQVFLVLLCASVLTLIMI